MLVVAPHLQRRARLARRLGGMAGHVVCVGAQGPGMCLTRQVGRGDGAFERTVEGGGNREVALGQPRLSEHALDVRGEIRQRRQGGHDPVVGERA